MPHAPAGFICRPMQVRDLATLSRYLPEVLSGTWSEESLQSQMHSNHEFLVLANEDVNSQIIAGFAEFYCVLDEFHLLNFAIFKPWQRQGLAQVFMQELLLVLRKRDCVQCLLEVRRSNERAVNLYEKTGFKLVGVRPAYYAPLVSAGPREDALLYSWSVSESC